MARPVGTLPPFPYRIFLLPAIGLPIVSSIAYLQNRPLNAAITRQIRHQHQLCTQESAVTSKGFSASTPWIVSLTTTDADANDASHAIAARDTYTIRIPDSHFPDLNDEEILARLTKGFFSGDIFTPQRLLLRLLSTFGWRVHGVRNESEGDSDSKTKDGSLPRKWEDDIPVSMVLPPQTTLHHGNFAVLAALATSTAVAASKEPISPHIDIAYGSPETSLAGIHRFQVDRAADAHTSLTLSSTCCRPRSDRMTFSTTVAFYFHQWYAGQLFRDAVREVLLPKEKIQGSGLTDLVDI